MTSLESALPAPSALAPWKTTTVRQCARALAWTLGLTAFFAVWYAVEKWWLRLDNDHRLARSPALTPMTILGIPHFLIGFLFLSTSRRMQGARAWATFAGLAALGVGLCALYAWGGGHHAYTKIPTAAVALYFVIHELRDEAFFFRAYGNAPKDVDPARLSRFLGTITALLVIVIGGIGIFGYDLHGRMKDRPGALDALLPGVPTLGRGGAVLAAVLVLAAARYLSWARSEPDGLGRWISRSRPMAWVYGLFLGVIVLGAASGTFLEAIVLWHVVEWFSFSMFDIARREVGRRATSAPPPATWLERVKGTRSGFLWLHLGLSVVVFAFLLVWTYVDARSTSSSLWFLVAPEAFYYWTIMHVTLSFFPR